jgi:Polyketide cyclase / dehydrase and lipid transport
VAVVERVIAATPERIFAVLADGWSYSDWVVGTTHIRDVDPGWPAPGTRIHHQAAAWPLSIKDTTVAVLCEPPYELLIRPRLWPLGAFTVWMSLTPLNERQTKVVLREDFAPGPMRRLSTKLNDMLLHIRNEEALRRLEDLAVRRAGREEPVRGR